MSAVSQPTAGQPPAFRRWSAKLFGESAVSQLAFAALIVATAVGIAVTPAFLNADNFRSILQDAALVGIVGVCMTPMAMSGNFVSLATQQSTVLSAMSFVYLVGTGTNVALAIVVVVAGLCFIGAVQGVIVAMGLNPVITTLAFGVITLGVINRVNSEGSSASVKGHEIGWGGDSVIGIPIHVIAFVVVTAIVTVVMAKTVIGRKTVLAGANRDTARLSGISITWVTIGVFALASVGMAIAGILGGAQFGVAGTSDFPGITIGAVAAILIGGTSIAGGLGSPLRTAFGAIVISSIQALMTLNGFSIGVRQAIEGALVVGVVVLIETVRRRGAGR